MSSVNGIPDHIPLHVVALLDRARRRYKAAMTELSGPWLASLNGEELRDAAGALSGSHFRLLSHIPPDGARVTDIAELADITKQSAGTFLVAMAECGLVETVPDLADRRTRLTRRTPLGDEMEAAVNALVAQVERRWRRSVGAKDYDALRRALIAIVTT
ncbi:MAG: MarR family transcriptional regulator [Aeromicrobium sp.]|nr:MarR family transcriptional regulator [Aeromicrobium sp.]